MKKIDLRQIKMNPEWERIGIGCEGEYYRISKEKGVIYEGNRRTIDILQELFATITILCRTWDRQTKSYN